MSDADAIAAIVYDVYEKALEPAEFDRRLAEILADKEEKKNIAELIEWFTRRYPTVEARLAYVRRHAKKRKAAPHS